MPNETAASLPRIDINVESKLSKIIYNSCMCRQNINEVTIHAKRQKPLKETTAEVASPTISDLA